MAHHGFELVREQPLAELKAQGLLYQHQTGARLLSLVNDDENKVFGITFRTPVNDSTGVPHILEHAVLCGSRKYPVKEPFVELMKGSLNTFLNAFTYPDRTCYPVASQNLQDFYNLIDVYLDAVFHPRLGPQVLQQEGWHYALDKPEEPLAYRGVVFNEMKGAYSDPEQLLAQTVQHSLFPDTTYGFESGGHPHHIPSLTYEQFKRFHKTYYHPANAFIWWSGDDDPARRLEVLAEYLDEFSPQAIDSTIGRQPRFAAPRRVVRPYAAERDEAKAIVTVNWLLGEALDLDTLRALQLLEYVLIGAPGAPLRKALLDSGLGEDLAGSGMEGELAEPFFGVGLKGVMPEKVDAVVALVVDTLERLAGAGIDPEMTTAALNTIEFRLREQNTGAYPRGLALMLGALTAWIYDRDPFAVLMFEDSLARIKLRLQEDGRYLEWLIREQLLENSHRTTVILQPDPELETHEAAAERERLATVKTGMTGEQLTQQLAANQQLRQLQVMPDPPEALAALPRLQLGDLERQIRTVPLEERTVAGTRVLSHDLFTHGIAYVDIGLELRALPLELLPYVTLFGRTLLEMGTQTQDYVKLNQRIGTYTGGLWTQSLISMVRDSQRSTAWLLLRGKAMLGQASELFAIAREVLLTVDFDDRERFRQLVLEEKAGEEMGLIPGGHRVASLRLQAQFNEAAWIAEQTKGLEYLFFLRRLVEEVENDWPSVKANLETIRQLLVNRQTMLVNVTLEEDSWPAFEPSLNAFLQALPAADQPPAQWPIAYRAANEGLILPAQVNYVAKAADLYAMGYTFDASLSVITRYLATTWLWERVRVQGGAYGAFCSFDLFSGMLGYASYRDPNLLETLEVFDRSSQFLQELELSDDELIKAIIGTIGDLDQYQLPDAKGYASLVRYLTRITDAFRQQVRDQVLDTRPEDFRAFAAVLEKVARQGRVTLMGGREAIEQADRKRGGWLEKIEVM